MNSRFNMMTINEISLNRLTVISGFCVIFGFYRLKLFHIASRFSAEALSSYRRFPSQSGFLEFVVFSVNFAEASATRNTNFPSFWVIKTSFAFSLLGYIADASNFSNSSISAVRMSHFQIHPAIKAYPRKIPGNTFFPS